MIPTFILRSKTGWLIVLAFDLFIIWMLSPRLAPLASFFLDDPTLPIADLPFGGELTLAVLYGLFVATGLVGLTILCLFAIIRENYGAVIPNGSTSANQETTIVRSLAKVIFVSIIILEPVVVYGAQTYDDPFAGLQGGKSFIETTIELFGAGIITLFHAIASYLTAAKLAVAVGEYDAARAEEILNKRKK